jgi:hypothetical protein
MFTAGVSSTDDAAIDILFGNKTPGADNLIGGEKKEEKKKEEKVETAPAADEKVETSVQTSDEEYLDNLFGKEEDTVDAEGKPIVKQEIKKAAAKLPDAQEVNYEAIYNDMVSQGIWEEVDIPEGTEFSKATFLEIQKLQAKSKYEDLLSNTGTYGKAIIEFEQSGGNPKELLDLFREQREVQEFDISNSAGQEEFLRAYLEAQGSSEKSIERQIMSFKAQSSEALAEEAAEKKEIWDAQYNDAIEARKNEQVNYAKQMEEAQRNFQKTIVSTLTSDAEATPKERKELQNYMLNYSQNFQGKQVSQFYVDMAQVQQDPKNYVELAKFIKGIKNGDYVKKVADKVKKETAAQSFIKIKNGAALRTTGGANPELDTTKGSTFLSLLNRK